MMFMIYILSFTTFLTAEMKVYGTVDVNRISVNETINFKVTAEESDGYPQLDILKIKDFTVISGPSQSSSFQWINGKILSSKSLSWTLIPNETGTLTIPTLNVTVDNKTYKLKPISITVIQSQVQRPKSGREEEADQETGIPIVFLKVEADKSEAFHGEQITVNYKLYTRVSLRRYSMKKKPQGIGFWLEELYVPKQPSLRDTRIDGIHYKVATLYKVALFPTTTGELTIDPMVLSCTVEIPTRSRIPSLFDDFFSDRLFSRTEQKIVQSESLIFNVKPVPELGKPGHYTGAVGEYHLSSFLDTTLTEVNQAVSYTVELSGTGNLGLFQLEEPVFPAGLEVFNPKTSFEKDPFRDEISGTKRLEYILIPRRKGRFLIPDMELAYFNPKSDRWESTSTEVLTVNVRPSRSILEQGQGLTKEEIALLSQDIRYIRITPVRLKPLDHRVIPNVFWWLSILGIVFFAGPGVMKGLSTNRKERVVEIRARKAFRKAFNKLKKVRDSKDYSDVTLAIYEYLAAKLNVPVASLDARTVRDLLDKTIDSTVIDSLMEIISVCDQAQYAPVDLSKLGKDAVRLAHRVLKLLDEIDKKL